MMQLMARLEVGSGVSHVARKPRQLTGPNPTTASHQQSFTKSPGGTVNDGRNF